MKGRRFGLLLLLLLSGALGLGGGCAHTPPVAPRGTGGTATVEFVNPAGFTDFTGSGPTGRSETRRLEAELAAYVMQEAGRHLGADREVLVRILDIDMGGETARGPRGIRVSGSSSSAMIELEYVLRDRAGATVSEGRKRLVESAESLPPGADVSDMPLLKQALRGWLRGLGPL